MVQVKRIIKDKDEARIVKKEKILMKMKMITMKKMLAKHLYHIGYENRKSKKRHRSIL